MVSHVLEGSSVCLSDQKRNYSRKRFKGCDQVVAQLAVAEELLQNTTGLKPAVEIFFPLLGVLHFHLIPVDPALQELVDLLEGQFTAVQRHAHSIATEWRDHARGVAEHQQVIFHLGLSVEGYAGYCNRFFIEKAGCGKYLIEEWIFAQDLLLHHPYIISRFPEIGCGCKIAQTILIILDFRNAAITVLEIVDRYQIVRKEGLDVVFYTHKVV